MAQTSSPDEIVSFGRPHGYIVFLDHLTLTRPDEAPEHVTGKRARFQVIITEKGKPPVKGNIAPDELLLIRDNTTAALSMHRRALAQAASMPPAYTARFMAGPWKGKSPADVLLGNLETPRMTLDGQYDYLAANVRRFPGNAKIMEGIRSAQTLQAEGRLHAAGALSLPPMDLYAVPIKTVEAIRREDGRCFTWSMGIQWHIGAEKSPITVQIWNAWRTIGAAEGEDASADDERRTFSIEYAEWYRALSRMEHTLSAFYNAAYPQARRVAQEMRKSWMESEKL